jgi:DNA-binding NtrC family response regulator
MSASVSPVPSPTARQPYSPPHDAGRSGFVGSHPLHLAALRGVEALAPYEHATVLIEGESGTGKSYVARLLHGRSPRSRAIFHQVILSALDDNLAASDLFGHLSGSYTDARQNRPGHFVTANRGTLFLDEIGKASGSVQRKLLHAVEHREIWPVGADRGVRLDVRLVAASNIPLATLVERGTFLEDLAARLANFRVRLPALRERRSDVPALVRQFIGLRAATCGHVVRAPQVHPELMAALHRADWPYNLRQLDGVVQRLLIEAAMQGSAELGLEHCVGELAYLREDERERERERPTPELVQARMTALGSATAVARDLGISRWTVYRYLERSADVQVGQD